ncbi:hypothetical protein SHIRM173S_01944 [Streptomyces hirsutus]
MGASRVRPDDEWLRQRSGAAAASHRTAPLCSGSTAVRP